MLQEQTIQQETSTEENQEPVISVRHLYKSFGSNDVLKDFNLDVYNGENVVVLGKSGSGKSVLIKCIIGLLEQDAGEITVLNDDVITLNNKQLDLLRAKVGFLFQSNALYDSMTVRENLEFPLRRHWIKLTAAETNDKVMEVLTNVGLAHTVDMMPAELSGGMRKRIALARTLILNPKIMLYDEPTAGLDPVTSMEINDLINEVQERFNTSSIIITHDLTCAKATGDRVAVLLEGHFLKEGSFDEVFASGDERIKSFYDYNFIT